MANREYFSVSRDARLQLSPAALAALVAAMEFDDTTCSNLWRAYEARLFMALSTSAITTSFQERVKLWLKVARVSQWSKNLFVFVPLLCSPHWSVADKWIEAVKIFFIFCLGASHLYIINDYLDRDADRRHSVKRTRPIASGAIPPQQALAGSALLGIGAVVLASHAAPGGLMLFVAYELGVLAYSLYVKQVLLADLFMLTGFFTLRVYSGGHATGVAVSSWLLLFSVFFFLSLAILKRFTELQWEEPGTEKGHNRRAYDHGDRVPLGVMGIASGMGAALILALYWNSPATEAIYQSPGWLWVLVPLFLFWICRIWLLAFRKEVQEDAIAFAFRDPVSLGVAVLASAFILLARFY